MVQDEPGVVEGEFTQMNVPSTNTAEACDGCSQYLPPDSEVYVRGEKQFCGRCHETAGNIMQAVKFQYSLDAGKAWDKAVEIMCYTTKK